MGAEAARGSVEIVEPTQLEQAHARRTAESKATIPHLYLETQAGVDAAVRTEAIVRACAVALRDFPRVNSAYRDGRFELYSRVNVAVEVAARHAVLYPVIRDADAQEASEIGERIAALARRAREGALTQPELSGATFTVADLGALGITRSGAVIQRGQAAILSAGAVREDGHMTLSLACDDRILHGPDAGAFLARVRSLLEGPAQGS